MRIRGFDVVKLRMGRVFDPSGDGDSIALDSEFALSSNRGSSDTTAPGPPSNAGRWRRSMRRRAGNGRSPPSFRSSLILIKSFAIGCPSGGILVVRWNGERHERKVGPRRDARALQ